VPGFPLDGGRILRSAIWAGTHDLRLATRWAVGVGRVVAILFVVIGAAMIFGFHVPPFGAGPMNGLWLVLIGWFLHDAAVASYGQLELKQALQDVPVARLMRREVPRVSPELSVSDLVEHWLLQGEQRAFPVMEGEHLAGLVTLEDVRKVPREQWNDLRVGDVMTPERDLEVVEEQAAAGEALGKLMRRNVEQLPVLANGHLEGIVRRADILRWVELRSGFAH
jgi:CBS domain-containing protein